MKFALHILSALMTLVAVAASPVGAWDQEEHRLLADSVFSVAMRTCAPSLSSEEAWSGGLTFGQRVAQFAANDFAGSRYHDRGKTVFEQLAEVSSERLALLDDSNSPVSDDDNVIAAFLSSHLRALRIAAGRNVGEIHDSAVLASALLEEARAQGYLADAFSAGHILSYSGLPFSFLQSRNRREAHDYHRNRGVYVVNGLGEVWQTFGDGLLHWYPPTHRAVFDACTAALNEVLVVWCVSNGVDLPDSLTAWFKSVDNDKTPEQATELWLSGETGRDYYDRIRLPSLMHLPMPVAATWSFRTNETDEFGVRKRHNYPQLRESGYHDPDLRDIEESILYSRESVPEWMIPEPLQRVSPTSAHEMVRSDPNWASVRFVQDRYATPSYKGILMHVGGQMTVRDDDTRVRGSIGIGYGFWDDLLLIKNVSASAILYPSFVATDRYLLTSTFGLAFDLPGEGWVKALHLEGGVGVGLGKDFDDYGPVFGLGFDSPVIPLHFTYAGITWRVKYQWFSLDTPVSGPSVEMILQ